MWQTITKKASQSVRRTAEAEGHRNSSYAPRRATDKQKQVVSIFKLRVYRLVSVFSTNELFSSTSFKYSTKCNTNTELRLEPGMKTRHLLFSFVVLFFNFLIRSGSQGDGGNTASASARACCIINTFTTNLEHRSLTFQLVSQ